MMSTRPGENDDMGDSRPTIKIDGIEVQVEEGVTIKALAEEYTRRKASYRQREKEDMGDNRVAVTIDGNEFLIRRGMTILEAAEENAIPIPTLCHHPALTSWGGCRLCVVQVDGSPKLAASCVTPIREGMVIETTNDVILESRRMTLEFLFAERNHHCMFCPQSGECELQNLAYALQMDHLTVSSSFAKFPADVTSEYMVIDHNRCVLCGRCVRACQEIAGAGVLNFQNRGPQTLIGLDLNEDRESSTCSSCGLCMQLCPTGAIYNRYRGHYAVKGHSRDWERKASLCPHCGLLCPNLSSVQDNTLIKVEGNLSYEKNRPDRGQLCYRGRFEIFEDSGNRLLYPMIRNSTGGWERAEWRDALALTGRRLRDSGEGAPLLGLISSSHSNETLLAFRELMGRGLGDGCVDTLDGDHARSLARAWAEIGNGFHEASWKSIPESDFIAVVGADPGHSQPLISPLIRKAVSMQKTRVAIMNDTEDVFPFVSHHLPLGPERVLLTRAFLGEALAQTKGRPCFSGHEGLSGVKPDISVPGILAAVGLDPEEQKAFCELVRDFTSASSPLIITGQGITGMEDPAPLIDLVHLALIKGLLAGNRLRLLILKPAGNSSGAWKLGLPSAEGLDGKAGWRGALVLLGKENVSQTPLPGPLKGIKFLAALSPTFPDALADQAHVLIPCPLREEERGTFTSLDGMETAFKEKILEAPAGVGDTWQTLWAISEAAGCRPPFSSWQDLSQRAEEEIKRPAVREPS